MDIKRGHSTEWSFLLVNNKMPITKDIAKNFHELYADNKKKGKARGANGKPRSRKQIIAIALSKSKKKKKSLKVINT